MGCFDNYIGIRNLCTPDTPAPVSGLYVQDLPGMTLEVAGNLSTNEYSGAVAFLNSKIAFAVKKVQDDLRDVWYDKLKFSPLVDVGFTGQWNTGSYDAVYAGYRGISISISRRSSSLMEIYIGRVRFLCNDTQVGVAYTITDGLTTISGTIDTTAGEVYTLEVNRSFEGEEVTITWDNTNIRVAECDTNASGCWECSSCCNSPFADIDGSDGSSNCYGVQAEFQVRCSEDRLMCLLRPQLGMATLYMLGMELVREMLTSTRLNTMTLNKSTEQKAVLLQEYMNEYTTRMQSLRNSIVSGIDRIKDECIVCNSNQYKYMIR